MKPIDQFLSMKSLCTTHSLALAWMQSKSKLIFDFILVELKKSNEGFFFRFISDIGQKARVWQAVVESNKTGNVEIMHK